MRVEKYGPASERLSDEQLKLLEQEPGVNEAEVKAESERAQLQLPLKGPEQRPVRQSLPVEVCASNNAEGAIDQACGLHVGGHESRWLMATRSETPTQAKEKTSAHRVVRVFRYRLVTRDETALILAFPVKCGPLRSPEQTRI
jgi:hypothetical protein